ncbi:BREX-4 system phosphatase PglZ [Desulfosporosinus shakirovi]|uniref:BREX-4 system phosphatase PglZ n=1 Tax=Desulfosporosinus shakirovi TaxID=2885154 RepID=UPI001E2923A1|nr:BREX-4 system phosphatase PglZ [Desulfosporosinus sp. SRJS8]MCB8817401.1 BREX-4 system phosphatase PglZ [Desulfosporosinus sp. SRJS8]
MQLEAVSRYLTSSVKTPYFLFVSDGQLTSVVEELSILGFVPVRVSTFCQYDKFPDTDELFEHIKTADVNVKDKKLLILGLGEYLGFKGNVEAANVLSYLKDMNIGGAKVVFVLRGLVTQIADLQADPRFDNRRFSVVDNAVCDLSFTLSSPSVGLSAEQGFQAMLSKLEDGECGNVVVNTAAQLDNALFTIHRINNAYEGIKFTILGFGLPRSCGSDTQWSELLSELNQEDSTVDKIFDKYGYSGNLETNFYARISGSDFRNWLYFIAIKQKATALKNTYLRFVAEKTSCFEDFRANVLNEIIDIHHTDKRFSDFYAERKILVEKFPEPDIADFVINNRKDPSEGIYKLTDRTKTEREEIISWVAKNGFVPQISDKYPALEAYQKQYIFNCGELSALLTDYFDAYKRQKISNALEEDFLTKVDELSILRKYNLLPQRSEIINTFDKNESFLFWLDALGVEYLAYISELARNRGLSISINIARADLPTITEMNRSFYDDWTGKKEKLDTLDETKHKDAGGYNFTINEMPIHLVKELEIIAEVIDRAATELALRRCKHFVIASDHGASRLAVLRRKEEKYDTDTKGEHSGRCCKLFEPYDLPFAAAEKGYLVLADYGRFKGSRAANVEVHGGASLEEVVIPIIELTLKKANVTVKLVEDDVTVDFRTGTNITLFINTTLSDVSLVLNGKRYIALPTDENHYEVALPDTKRAGDYPADVYAGDDLIGQVLIKAKGKSGKSNDDFDNLFDLF